MSTSDPQQLVEPGTERVQGDLMPVLHGGGVGSHRCEGIVGERREGFPPGPVKASVVARSCRATEAAATMFGLRPDVENSTTTSPGRTNAFTWRAKTSSYP